MGTHRDTGGKAGEGSYSALRVSERRRKQHHITISEQVWTLAKQRFGNVSRIVERLLEVALGLKSSVEIVRFGESVLVGAGVAEPGQRRWTQDPLP
ncbi:putative integrase [Thermococcus barophilus]|uniref:Putative integrase n=1 Tax=Thermococcus barophilus TaxID=55802 RepID=A0A0S1XFE6_THEBA|nr:putative integrase [Thermococcus barophilus]